MSARSALRTTDTHDILARGSKGSNPVGHTVFQPAVRNGEHAARDIELAIKEKVSLMPRTRREQPSSILHATEVRILRSTLRL
jgi:hypothetical protein